MSVRKFQQVVFDRRNTPKTHHSHRPNCQGATSRSSSRNMWRDRPVLALAAALSTDETQSMANPPSPLHPPPPPLSRVHLPLYLLACVGHCRSRSPACTGCRAKCESCSNSIVPEKRLASVSIRKAQRYPRMRYHETAWTTCPVLLKPKWKKRRNGS